MMHWLFFSLVFALLPLVTCDSSELTSVTIRNGTLVGLTDAQNGVQKFLGVPFAEPPVGDLRLRQAVPLEKAFGTRHADNLGASCFGTGKQGNSSEDCLTLNIWKPTRKEARNESLPVLVWLYGGGLTNGYTV
jgi:carboxylesterase type B